MSKISANILRRHAKLNNKQKRAGEQKMPSKWKKAGKMANEKGFYLFKRSTWHGQNILVRSRPGLAQSQCQSQSQ